MINLKLEEAIKKALSGQYFGNCKVVVETDTTGAVDVYEYDEEEDSESEAKIEELEGIIEELKEENGELEEQVQILQDKIEEIEGL